MRQRTGVAAGDTGKVAGAVVGDELGKALGVEVSAGLCVAFSWAGLNTCGNVARFCASACVGRNKAPFCPQAASAMMEQAQPTIGLNFNMFSFYLS
jgi:hypothetical protein